MKSMNCVRNVVNVQKHEDDEEGNRTKKTGLRETGREAERNICITTR